MQAILRGQICQNELGIYALRWKEVGSIHVPRNESYTKDQHHAET